MLQFWPYLITLNSCFWFTQDKRIKPLWASVYIYLSPWEYRKWRSEESLVRSELSGKNIRCVYSGRYYIYISDIWRLFWLSWPWRPKHKLNITGEKNNYQDLILVHLPTQPSSSICSCSFYVVPSVVVPTLLYSLSRWQYAICNKKNRATWYRGITCQILCSEIIIHDVIVVYQCVA